MRRPTARALLRLATGRTDRADVEASAGAGESAQVGEHDLPTVFIDRSDQGVADEQATQRVEPFADYHELLDAVMATVPEDKKQEAETAFVHAVIDRFQFEIVSRIEPVTADRSARPLDVDEMVAEPQSTAMRMAAIDAAEKTREAFGFAAGGAVATLLRDWVSSQTMLGETMFTLRRAQIRAGAHRPTGLVLAFWASSIADSWNPTDAARSNPGVADVEARIRSAAALQDPHLLRALPDLVEAVVSREQSRAAAVRAEHVRKAGHDRIDSVRYLGQELPPQIEEAARFGLLHRVTQTTGLDVDQMPLSDAGRTAAVREALFVAATAVQVDLAVATHSPVGRALRELVDDPEVVKSVVAAAVDGVSPAQWGQNISDLVVAGMATEMSAEVSAVISEMILGATASSAPLLVAAADVTLAPVHARVL